LIEVSGKLHVQDPLSLEKELQIFSGYGGDWASKSVGISWQTEKFLKLAYSTISAILNY